MKKHEIILVLFFNYEANLGTDDIIGNQVMCYDAYMVLLDAIEAADSLGGAYALIAIGYTMVYGILRMINFAHGDIFMLTGYFAIYSLAVFPW